LRDQIIEAHKALHRKEVEDKKNLKEKRIKDSRNLYLIKEGGRFIIIKYYCVYKAILTSLLFIPSCVGQKSSRGGSISIRYGKTSKIRKMEITDVA